MPAFLACKGVCSDALVYAGDSFWSAFSSVFAGRSLSRTLWAWATPVTGSRPSGDSGGSPTCKPPFVIQLREAVIVQGSASKALQNYRLGDEQSHRGVSTP